MADALAGIRHPWLAAPLATYTGWSLRATGFAPGELCGTNGSYVPFAQTREQRLASGDPRPSVQERYRNHGAYVSAIAREVARQVSDRILLEEDATRIMDAVSAQDTAEARAAMRAHLANSQERYRARLRKPDISGKPRSARGA